MPRHLPSHVLSGAPGRRAMAPVVAALLIGALAACSPAGPAAAPSPTPSTSASTQPPDAPAPSAPAEPTLVPEGTATDNLPVFAAVTASVWASENRVAGRAYVDALVQAGFEKSAMQVTDDQTTVGNPAESIQFSVRWGDECLIGQVGPATGEPVTAVMPALAEGTCLIGQTRTIDW